MIQTWQQPVSMDAIPEESERLQTETHNKSQCDDSNSFELLIKAHDRIRSLEQQNQELRQQLADLADLHNTNKELAAEIDRLTNILREKQIKIENLEKLNQKAILDYVRLERSVIEQKEGRLKRNLTALPNELKSPLHPIIRNGEQQGERSKSRESSLRNQTPTNYKDLFKREERLQFSSKENKPVAPTFQFTFDGGLKQMSSPKKGTLKNCFSLNEISKMVNKVHSRHDNQLNHHKERIKEYQHFCSSMQKKYSPSASIKKEQAWPKKQPLHLKQTQSPKNLQFRGATPKKWELNSTSSSQNGVPFNVWKSENYTFN